MQVGEQTEDDLNLIKENRLEDKIKKKVKDILLNKHTGKREKDGGTVFNEGNNQKGKGEFEEDDKGSPYGLHVFSGFLRFVYGLAGSIII